MTTSGSGSARGGQPNRALHTHSGRGWQAVLEVGAGTGGVYLLRWYWWRINAWSEISAMATALVMTVLLRLAAPFSGTRL